MFPLAAEILDTGLLNNNLLSDTFQLASVSRGALLFSSARFANQVLQGHF
jgi:hypothetical protein